MPADGQSAPATPDELAAIYLRARDVPCPGCGYNRRDGQSVACPECGHTIGLDVEKPFGIPVRPRLASALLWAFLIVGIPSVPAIAHLLVTNTSAAFPNANAYARWMAPLLLQAIGWVFCIRYAIPALSRIGRRDLSAGQLFSRAVLAFVAANLVHATWLFWYVPFVLSNIL